MQHALPPDFPISSRARTPPAVATAVSKCEFIGGSDDESDVVRRKKKTTTVYVVNIKRLDVRVIWPLVLCYPSFLVLVF